MASTKTWNISIKDLMDETYSYTDVVEWYAEGHYFHLEWPNQSVLIPHNRIKYISATEVTTGQVQ